MANPYEPHNWVPTDYVTPSAMNNLEQGIQEALDVVAPNVTNETDLASYWANTLKRHGVFVKYTTSSNRDAFYNLGLSHASNNCHLIFYRLSITEGIIVSKLQGENSPTIHLKFIHGGTAGNWYSLVPTAD